MNEVALVTLGIAVGGAAVGAVAGVLRHRQGARSSAAVGAVERALADERRVAAEERAVQDLVLSSMEEGVLVVDRNGGRVFANQALDRHLGTDPGSLAELRPEALRQAVGRAGFTGAPAHLEFETGAPSRWLRASILPVGTDGAVLLVVDDVTEARHLDAVRRDFVANASHELKSPVAAIRAAAETLRDGAVEDPPAAARFTEQLELEAVRLSRIVSDLLDLSRLEAGSERDERVRLDVVATEETERLAVRALERGVTLEIRADAVASIAGSARDLALLVRNLIDNAVGYTPEGGRVDVDVRGEATRVLLAVRDTGIGIPQRDLPRIFERFYRVDRARSRETGGTGLGLAIVKHVAENHGATLEVTSELGVGTAFEVGFPIA
jgi:signal transduction histidine kinase